MITSDDVNLFNSRNAHGVIVPHHRLYQSVSHPTHSKPNNPPTGGSGSWLFHAAHKYNRAGFLSLQACQLTILHSPPKSS